MKQKKWRGGARIEQFGITWPFATLTVTERSLILKVILGGIFRFAPEEVLKIESWGFLHVIWEGIQIHHNKTSYPSDIIFTCWNSQSIINEIRQYGYNI